MISDTELATGGMDNTLRIWDLAKMEESNTLSGVKAFFALDYSPRSKVSHHIFYYVLNYINAFYDLAQVFLRVLIIAVI